MGRTMLKRVFADSECSDQPVHPQSDKSLYCPLTELLTTTECINGEKMSG